MKGAHAKCLLCEAHRKSPVCRTSAESRHFQDQLCTVNYRPGERLFSQGDATGSVYFVSAGAIRLIHHHPDGTQQILRIAGAGELLGIGISDGAVMMATAVAFKSSSVCRARLSDMDALVRRDPDFALAWTHLLQEEIQRAREIIFHLSAHPASVRLARFLWQRERQARERKPKAPGHVEIELTHADIAASLSIAQETATRLLGDLEDKGIVRLSRGRIEILDGDRLVALAGFPDSEPTTAFG